MSKRCIAAFSVVSALSLPALARAECASSRELTQTLAQGVEFQGPRGFDEQVDVTFKADGAATVVYVLYPMEGSDMSWVPASYVVSGGPWAGYRLTLIENPDSAAPARRETVYEMAFGAGFAELLAPGKPLLRASIELCGSR